MRTRNPQKNRFVKSYTASATLTASSFEGIHDNRGCAADVTLTLPAPAAIKGMQAWFMRISASYAILLDPAGTEVFTEVDGGASAAGKYESLASDGGTVLLTSDGTRYIILASRGTITEEA